jgi:glycosyltransferase involved in cell wall biosynthesis
VTDNLIRIAHVTTVDMSLRLLLLDQLRAIRDAGYDVSAISASGPDVREIERAGIPHHAVSFTRSMTPLRDLAALAQLVAHFRSHNYHIVHTHTPKAGLLGQLAARIAGVPVIINTIHGFYFHEHMKPAARRAHVLAERLAASCSTAILSQNPEDVETAVKESIAERSQISLLGNGIDLNRFRPEARQELRDRARRDLGIPEDARVVGFVGRLVREKGVPELLAALETVRRDVPDLVCVLVGPVDNEKTDAIRPEQFDHADGWMRFVGARDDMPLMYSAMDIFALPSHREGFPRSPMEAAAMGIPVIATDIRGCRETVRHMETGVLVPLGDVDALTTALTLLLGNPELRQKMGQAAVSLAQQEFDQQRVFDRVLDAYHRTLIAAGLKPPALRTGHE